MQRWLTTFVGFAVVVLTVWLVARDFHPPKAIGHDPSPPPSASASDGGTLPSATATGGGGAGADDGGPLLLSDILDGRRVDAGAGVQMLDGTPVPPLPLSAPRQVRFGVVLVSYTGAQPSPGSGGKPATRSKTEAKELATTLVATASQDFHAAVQQGDPGSSDDVGHVKLGVLEPAPEYVLFTLNVDGIGGPIDTPRGYWVVKRLE